jgi:hypothetical protein
MGLNTLMQFKNLRNMRREGAVDRFNCYNVACTTMKLAGRIGGYLLDHNFVSVGRLFPQLLASRLEAGAFQR